jgi:DNA-nicking Smr family endonuclease
MRSRSRNTFKSFEELTRFLIENRSKQRQRKTTTYLKETEGSIAAETDDMQAFQEAMRGVTPLSRSDWSEDSPSMPLNPLTIQNDRKNEEIAKLEALVESGAGFMVSQTSEYVEGIGYRVRPEITTRLHMGDFAIQSHIDLHGFGVKLAKETLDCFLKDAIRTGKRQILIIHGRGLSSPSKPVLKTRICEWLTAGAWRKWVIAFTSARLCDGGSGATYVLLRRRPLTRRFKKKRLNPEDFQKAPLA